MSPAHAAFRRPRAATDAAHKAVSLTTRQQRIPSRTIAAAVAGGGAGGGPSPAQVAGRESDQSDPDSSPDLEQRATFTARTPERKSAAARSSLTKQTTLSPVAPSFFPQIEEYGISTPDACQVYVPPHARAGGGHVAHGGWIAHHDELRPHYETFAHPVPLAPMTMPVPMHHLAYPLPPHMFEYGFAPPHFEHGYALPPHVFFGAPPLAHSPFAHHEFAHADLAHFAPHFAPDRPLTRTISPPQHRNAQQQSPPLFGAQDFPPLDRPAHAQRDSYRVPAAHRPIGQINSTRLWAHEDEPAPRPRPRVKTAFGASAVKPRPGTLKWDGPKTEVMCRLARGDMIERTGSVKLFDPVKVSRLVRTA